MEDVFLGTIKSFPYEFAPLGWALCDGRLMSVAQNQALFALIGNRFGGDGRTTFALPDLRGAAPDALRIVGSGQEGYCQYYMATMGIFPIRP